MAGAPKAEVNIETLAALAEQGGASPELAAVQFDSTPSSVPERVKISEAINPETPPAPQA